MQKLHAEHLPRHQHRCFTVGNLDRRLEAWAFGQGEYHLATVCKRGSRVTIDDRAREWRGDALLLLKLIQIGPELGQLCGEFGYFRATLGLGTLSVTKNRLLGALHRPRAVRRLLNQVLALTQLLRRGPRLHCRCVELVS